MRNTLARHTLNTWDILRAENLLIFGKEYNLDKLNLIAFMNTSTKEKILKYQKAILVRKDLNAK